MPDIRDFLPQPPWKGPPIPEYLLKRYPFLKGMPQEIWERFWPFPELPPKLTGSLPWAIEKSREVYSLPISKEEKYLRWSEIIMDAYYKRLLTEGEKAEYLVWEFAW